MPQARPAGALLAPGDTCGGDVLVVSRELVRAARNEAKPRDAHQKEQVPRLVGQGSKAQVLPSHPRFGPACFSVVQREVGVIRKWDGRLCRQK